VDCEFLTFEAVIGFHLVQINTFEGVEVGYTDIGLLESAMCSAIHQWCYNPDADHYDIAAAYAYHITIDHPFTDGNKRVGLAAALAYLALNKAEMKATPDVL
jgi:death-on-curing protein